MPICEKVGFALGYTEVEIGCTKQKDSLARLLVGSTPRSPSFRLSRVLIGGGGERQLRSTVRFFLTRNMYVVNV